MFIFNNFSEWIKYFDQYGLKYKKLKAFFLFFNFVLPALR